MTLPWSEVRTQRRQLHRVWWEEEVTPWGVVKEGSLAEVAFASGLEG